MKKKFLSNTTWLIGGKIFQMLISLVISTITVRYLGPTNFGVLSYTNSFIVFFTSIASLGLNTIIVKELLKYPNNQGEILGTGIVMRLLASILSMISIIILLMIINENDKSILIIAFLQSFILLFSSFDLITYWYQSKLMSKYSTIIQSIAYVAMSLYKIYILTTNKSVEWFAFSTSLDLFIIAILLLVAYKYHGGNKLKFSFGTSISLINQSYHFIFAGIMVALFSQIDRVMIGNLMDAKSVGLYSTAITLTGLWSFIPVALIDSARPVIMEQKYICQNTYILRLKQLYAIVIWLSIIYGIFMSIFGEFILSLLYGKDYLDALPALLIVVWYCSFSYLGAAKNIWLISEDKSKYEKWFTFLGALLNISLNFVLIPNFGIVGAAFATLLTQIVTNVILPLFFKGTRLNTIYIYEAFILKGVIPKDINRKVSQYFKFNFIGKIT